MSTPNSRRLSPGNDRCPKNGFDRPCAARYWAGVGRLSIPLVWIVLSTTVAVMPGCSGCRSDDSAQTAEQREAERKSKELQKKKEKKKDFEIANVETRPGKRQDRAQSVKPGHWVNVSQEIKTNNFDFSGRLEAGVVDKDGRPIYLDRTPFRLTTTRPAQLPKGEAKQLDMLLFVPHESGTTRITTSLWGPGGGTVPPTTEFFQAMPPYQYHFVVLAGQPEQYAYLNVLDSIRAPFSQDGLVQSPPHYLVSLVPAKRRPPLPSQALSWTSTAHVLWDDAAPGILTREQQTALVDWLHWGGQLIVSGPNSLDTLRGSFLDPYLPAKSGGARQLSREDLSPLSTHWTVPAKGNRPGQALKVTHDWSGVSLQRQDDAQFVPKTNDLLVERRVGRGRIVVSAFRLSERDLLNWSGFDGFFNACLLRHPPREFEESIYTADGISVEWADKSRSVQDPRLTCNLRYIVRDAGNEANYSFQNETNELLDPYGQGMSQRPAESVKGRGGVAAWDDFGPVASAARNALRDAAGIKVPSASFVVKLLAVYLFIIVPVNWFVFKAIGRVEWAWVAAPMIAVICGAIVIPLAQVDIGFARAQTEIAVLETQPGYSRGHLARYTALYTSLSTTYDVRYDDLSAVVEPFPDPDFSLTTGQSRSTVTYERYRDVALTGFTVSSNSTDMIHSEQMYDLGGSFALANDNGGPARVTNNTTLNLTGAVVLHRKGTESAPGPMEAASIGSLAAGESAAVQYQQIGSPDELVRFIRKHNGKPVSPDDHSDNLDLTLLTSTVGLDDFLGFGDAVLVGKVDKMLPGITIEPASNQVRTATLAVAHLAYGSLDTPGRDVNSRVAPRAADTREASPQP